MNTISDCKEFSLIRHSGQKVSGTIPINEISNIVQDACFLACFNMTGCYTFSYASGLCQLYTGCGASCTLIADSSFTTYVRECSQPVTTTTGT